MQFTDVATGHKIQPGRLWVGDLWFLCSVRWQYRDGIYTLISCVARGVGSSFLCCS